jgi:hypothetical protein
VSRYAHNGGAHVYDDDLDQWFRFADPDDGAAFAAETTDPQQAEVVQVDVPARFATTSAVFTSPAAQAGVFARSGALQVLPADPTRSRARIGYANATGVGMVVVIGTKYDLASNGGYLMGVPAGTYEDVTIQATDEVWAALQAGAVNTNFGTGTVCAISEYFG